jgi:hypothetical protein
VSWLNNIFDLTSDDASGQGFGNSCIVRDGHQHARNVGLRSLSRSNVTITGADLDLAILLLFFYANDIPFSIL